MTTMASRLFIIAFLVSTAFGFSQTQDSTIVKKQAVKDTIIDGQSQIKKEIAPVIDSLSKRTLEDHKLASGRQPIRRKNI